MTQAAQDPADYVLPLYMNGLEGRVLKLPASGKGSREILFIYGQHSSLERWWGAAQVLQKYGNVTIPDLPGFGGMTSLYKIGRRGSIDELADYLAAYVKLRYKKQPITIFGMSLGFAIVTRMLQRYPTLVPRVDMLVSIVGLAHAEDFIFSARRRRFYAAFSWLYSRSGVAVLFRLLFLNPSYLRRVYKHSRFAKEKLAKLSGDEFKETMDMELRLWKINDIRTQMQTNYEMMTLDNTMAKVALPVWHVASHKDRYFNHAKVEEHFRKIFNDFHIFYTRDPNHAPTIIADSKAAGPFFPAGLRRALAAKSKAKKK
ncbi:alpha/beta hydrolase [Candidatus Saccharibacteria bacterium]|nr:alpha/beta hydrolase [Candidatus Saccharibacteria bacterium]